MPRRAAGGGRRAEDGLSMDDCAHMARRTRPDPRFPCVPRSPVGGHRGQLDDSPVGLKHPPVPALPESKAFAFVDLLGPIREPPPAQ
jgi:hypothetical protein